MCALFSEYESRPVGDRPEPDWDLRVACAGDSKALAALVAAREGGPEADLHERLHGELERIAAGAARALWVAERAGGVVAFARAAYWESSSTVESFDGPSGWYLGGVIVHPAHRRLGIAADLTRTRLAWLADRTSECYFVVNVGNRASIDLHQPFGFHEIARAPELSGVRFTGGLGVLFRAVCGAVMIEQETIEQE